MSSRRSLHHIPELDGLRGIAIAIVVLYHAFTRPEFPRATEWLSLGWAGVDLFFVLSGFLITRILIDTRGGRHYFRNFYGRRSLRIWPLYYSALLVIFYLLPSLSHALRFDQAAYSLGTYALYLQNIRLHDWGPDHLTPTWSLAVEEQFYLVWPFIVALFARKWLGRVLVAFVVLPLAFRLAASAMGAGTFFLHTFPLCRFDTMAVGGLLAWLLAGNLRPTTLRRTSFAALAIGAAGCYSLRIIPDTIGAALIYSLLALFFVGVLGLALSSAGADGLFARTLRTPPLRQLGKISYGVYLIHVPVLVYFRTFVESHLWLGMLLQLAVIFGLALLSWHAFEQPILRLKSRFAYRDDNRSSEPLSDPEKNNPVLEPAL